VTKESAWRLYTQSARLDLLLVCRVGSVCVVRAELRLVARTIYLVGIISLGSVPVRRERTGKRFDRTPRVASLRSNYSARVQQLLGVYWYRVAQSVAQRYV